MNMLSLRTMSPLNGKEPVLVMVMPNVQSPPSAQAAGAVLTMVSCVPPSAHA